MKHFEAFQSDQFYKGTEQLPQTLSFGSKIEVRGERSIPINSLNVKKLISDSTSINIDTDIISQIAWL